MKKQFCKVLAGLAASLLGLSVQAAIIPVSPGTGNIQTAIAAAANGDILELSTGNYLEGFLAIGKSLTFRNATGASPVLIFSNTAITPGTATFVMDITVPDVIFDGVDIVLDGNDLHAPGTIRGIVIRGAATTLANAATFRNLDISDTPTGPVAGYWVFSVESNLILDNVTAVIDNALPQVPVGIIGSGQALSITDCDLNIVSSNGVVYLQDANKVLTVNRSKITGTGIYGTFAAVPSITVTNTLFNYNAAAQPRSAIFAESGGNVTLRHCTFTDTNSTTFTRPIRFSDNSAAGAVGLLTVQNCLFNVPTNPAAKVQAYIWEIAAAPATNITYNIGKNAVRKDPALDNFPADDRIGLGTVLIGDPNLIDDVHLGDPSVALGNGLAIGITEDIDGQSRPNPVGSLPDLGASESFLVPVEASEFTID